MWVINSIYAHIQIYIRTCIYTKLLYIQWVCLYKSFHILPYIILLFLFTFIIDIINYSRVMIFLLQLYKMSVLHYLITKYIMELFIIHHQ